MKKILVSGISFYEIEGVATLFKSIEFSVECKDIRIATGNFDLIIAALSSVPLNGWGKYINLLYNLRRNTSGKIIILTPKKLNKLKLLAQLGVVNCGCMKPDDLRKNLFLHLNEYESSHSHISVVFSKSHIKLLHRIKTNSLIRRKNICVTKDSTEYYYRRDLIKRAGVNHLLTLFSAQLDEVIIIGNDIH
ncbi:TPA: hypothetical protein N8X53_004285 [Escherichia coli]|nr:hypothetical protein [Escherichia coli]